MRFIRAILGFDVPYKDYLGEKAVKRVSEPALNNMDFRPKEKLDEALVKAAGLFPCYDIYSGSDYLAAEYKSHRFIQSDICLQERREESYWDDGELKRRTIYFTVFSGRLMIFDYDGISDELVAVYDRNGSKLKGTGTVQTELETFNRKFCVSAVNQASALRILTLPVLEGIVLASGKLGSPLYLSFREDKLYVALANRDAVLYGQRRSVSDEIKGILELVDTLYLKKQP